MKITDTLVQQLMDRIFTTNSLKQVSDTLSELSLDKRFKMHINSIVTDSSLTDPQKARQITYILKTIEVPVLYDFLSDVAAVNLWLFSSDRIDYFDNFVQQFQLATENLEVVYLTTAIELPPSELKNIAKDLGAAFNRKVVIKSEINLAIMGGAQVRVENMIYDFSLRSKFTQFERQWLSSVKETEKLIGRNEPL